MEQSYYISPCLWNTLPVYCIQRPRTFMKKITLFTMPYIQNRISNSYLHCLMQLHVTFQPQKSWWIFRSLYIWDIHDVNQATECGLVSRSPCIWDIKNLCCENMPDPSLACTTKGCLGEISFARCSTDGTVKLWDNSLQSNLSKKDAEQLNKELLDSLCLVSAGTFERGAVKVDLTHHKFRSLAVSLNEKYLVAGYCKGNLHIFNRQISDYTCLQGARDAEILTLSFTLSTQDISEEIAKGS